MTTPTLRLLPLASPGCACCAPSAPSAPTPDPAAARSAAPSEAAATYRVTDMTCGHCAASATAAVRALPLVDDVHIELAASGVSTVTVTGTASPPAVRHAIEDAGYTVLVS